MVAVRSVLVQDARLSLANRRFHEWSVTENLLLVSPGQSRSVWSVKSVLHFLQ
jgi:hypothetical protein